MPKADDITCWDKKPNAIDNEGHTSIDDTNCSSYSGKMPVKMNFNEDTEIEIHKLVIHKPWFSPSFSVNNSVSNKDIPVSDSLVFKEFHPVSVQSIPNTPNIYMIYIIVQERLNPHKNRQPQNIDKFSKWSIF